MTMFRVTTQFSGLTGLPGYCNLHFIHADPPTTQAQNAVNNVRAFFESVITLAPSPMTYQINADVAEVDEIDGSIDSYVPTTPPAKSAVSPAGTYSAPTGGCVDWLTSGVVASHRVMGRTFLVPLVSTAFQVDGTLSTSAITTITNAANALRVATGPTLCVWARPFEPEEGDDRPARAGSAHPVVAVRIPDKSVVLRSRRD